MEFDCKKGQHLLKDKDIIEKEISAARLSKKDFVIEIGAGKGYLTEALAKKAGKVLAFEIEESFQDSLKQLQKKYSNLSIIYGDAMKYSWRDYNKIISNIPYHLSEAILMKSIHYLIKLMTLITGEKLKHSLESETKIGFIMRTFYKIEPLFKVESKSFIPSPKVNSWLINFKPKKPKSKKEEIIRDIILGRGKIKNSIMRAFITQGFTKRQSKEKVDSLDLDEQVLNKPVNRITYKFLKLLDERL